MWKWTGKEEHLNDFLESARPLIRNYANAVSSHGIRRDDMEDFIQEISVKLFKSAPRLRPATFHPFLHRVVVNHFIDRLRRGRDRTVPLLSELEGGREMEREISVPDPALAFVNSGFSEHVGKALDELYPDFRRTVELVDIDGCSYKEAAEKTGTTIENVRSRLHRGRKALRALMEKHQRAGEE